MPAKDIFKRCSKLKADLALDGTIDDVQIQNRLLTAATVTQEHKEAIHDNMEEKYGEGHVANFEQFIDLFINNSSYTSYYDVIFPKTYQGYVNVLRIEGDIDPSKNYAVIVNPAPESVPFYMNYLCVSATFFTDDYDFPANTPNNSQVEANNYLVNQDYYLGSATCPGTDENNCVQATTGATITSLPGSL